MQARKKQRIIDQKKFHFQQERREQKEKEVIAEAIIKSYERSKRELELQLQDPDLALCLQAVTSHFQPFLSKSSSQCLLQPNEFCRACIVTTIDEIKSKVDEALKQKQQEIEEFVTDQKAFSEYLQIQQVEKEVSEEMKKIISTNALEIQQQKKDLTTIYHELAKNGVRFYASQSAKKDFLTAAEKNNLELLKFFYTAGINLDVQIEGSSTALGFAVSNNYFPCVEFLLSKGANPFITDRNGNNAFSYITSEPVRELLRLYSPKAPLQIVP